MKRVCRRRFVRRSGGMRRTTTILIFTIVIGALPAGTACGDVGESNVQVHGGPSLPPATECQDHTLPCAGEPITGPGSPVPVMDPARHDNTVIDGIMHPTTTTGITLPVTR